MNKAVIDDGCNVELMTNFTFDKVLEFPLIKDEIEIIIPKGLVPYSKINNKTDKELFVCFYENDTKFREILLNPEEAYRRIKAFKGIVMPDCSLIIDEPIWVQLTNIGRNKTFARLMQDKGKYVIPNPRWGDERTYGTTLFNEPPAFVGYPHNSIVSVGTYGCIKTKEQQILFKNGFRSMIEYLKPKVVLVYGNTPAFIFNEFKEKTKIVSYPDWTKYMKQGGKHGY